MTVSSRIRLTFLGTGTSQGVPIIGCDCPVCRSADPRDKRLRTSAMITSGEEHFVIDAGPDFRQQMLTAAISHLRAILITHEHVDHIFGLDDIRAFNYIQKKPLDIYAEPRVQTAIRRIFDYVFAADRYPGVPRMELHEVTHAPFLIGQTPFIPIRAYHHKLPVLGFRTGDLTYLTDINAVPEEEMEKLRGTRILVVNALRHEKHLSHFNLEEAIRFSRKVGPEQTYLTHISHALGFHMEVQKTLPPGIFLAYDGLTLEI